MTGIKNRQTDKQTDGEINISRQIVRLRDSKTGRRYRLSSSSIKSFALFLTQWSCISCPSGPMSPTFSLTADDRGKSSVLPDRS